jgi:hypothetical protein
MWKLLISEIEQFENDSHPKISDGQNVVQSFEENTKIDFLEDWFSVGYTPEVPITVAARSKA